MRKSTIFSIVLGSVALSACATQQLPPSPDSTAFAAQAAIASDAGAVDQRARQLPTYAGFYISRDEPNRAQFLFTQTPAASLATLTRDARFSARQADYTLSDLQDAERLAETEIRRLGIQFEIVSLDVARNRVVISGLNRSEIQQKRPAFVADQRVAVFFRSQ